MTQDEIGFWLLIVPLGIVLWTVAFGITAFVCIGVAEKLK